MLINLQKLHKIRNFVLAIAHVTTANWTSKTVHIKYQELVKPLTDYKVYYRAGVHKVLMTIFQLKEPAYE